jgi:hypothetical protein
LLFTALAWVDFRQYVRLRQRLFAAPAVSVTTASDQHWTAWLRYLCQGLLVPGFVLLLLSLLLGRAVPVADYAGPDRETMLKEQLEQAQRLQADWRGNPGVVMLQKTLEMERAVRLSVRSGQIAIAAMVPVAVAILTAFAPLIWADVALRRLMTPKVRAAAAYTLGTHLFWVNASNMLFVGLVAFVLRQKPYYGFGIGLELIYFLFLLLLLGGAGYLVSRNLREALALPALPVKRAYLAGDKVKWTVYFVHIFSAALVFAVAVVCA